MLKKFGISFLYPLWNSSSLDHFLPLLLSLGQVEKFSKSSKILVPPDLSGPSHRTLVRNIGLVRSSFRTCPTSYQINRSQPKSSQLVWFLQSLLIFVIMWIFLWYIKKDGSMVRIDSSCINTLCCLERSHLWSIFWGNHKQ
jgi:hypothetical protein